MKTAVIYNSQTGFTKKYAEWIAEAAGADCFELEAAKKQDFDRYDAIVFGGWACAGRISKISWFKSNIDKWSDKTLIAFCTGGSPAESPEIEPFLSNNFSEAEREKVHVFYFPGGFSYEKMSASSKLMIKMFQKMVTAKKDKTEADIEMLKMISHSYDISDRKYIEPIIKLLNDKANR
ncbi:MAG: flavodoxin family protein [Acutalibacteraceae bacterium]